ncbi:sphingomyelin phosphodiesterase-like isoform X1 [Macrobrachium nipponense]|uniref:sphingomyelin phosphodiesterase-like isoform X1 n=2 Tax=Macrobrachium nipponense TaxID=159736 RepID=UPI0030C87068
MVLYHIISGVRMLSGLLLHLTTFLTSLGLGEWFGAGAGADVARGRSSPSNPDAQVVHLSNEIDSWISLPEPSLSNMPFHLHQVLSALNGSEYESDTGTDGTDRIFRPSDTYCGSCKILSKMVTGYSRLGGPIDIMATFLIKICYIVYYQSMPVCRGIINQDKDRLEWILKNSNTEADEVCALVLGDQGCGVFQRAPWSVNIPPPDPKTYYGAPGSPAANNGRNLDTLQKRQIGAGIASGLLVQQASQQQQQQQQRVLLQQASQQQPQSKSHNQQPILTEASANINEKVGLVSEGKHVLKVLHLTDPHFDPEYQVGSNAVCEAPMCCNADSGVPKRPADAAGKWGDYRNCDSPRWLLQHMLHHIVTNHPDIDYVLCTGDLVPHHIWKITEQDNIAVMKEMTDMFLEYFPNIPIYSSIGNHESFPRDSFPPPEVPEVWQKFGVQWLYDSVTEQWGKLMREPAPNSARFGGYYSVVVKPGLRIISLNTNYCYRLNWWLLYKSIDPGLVLRWLVTELQKAEGRGELVHIIGHIPPYYSDCYAQWAHQFSRIVSRYSHIIRGQFYGHSHMDEFRVHYDVHAPKKPIGVQYITPNNGPFQGLNPSYRIFYVDGDHPETTRNVLDYETWVMNLTHANKFDAPHWYQLYTARRDLQLPSLDPKNWDELVQRMAKNPSLFAKYYRYQVQDSDVALERGCDARCRKKTLCSIVEGDTMMPPKCSRRG